jgi:hypothetical protein
VALLCSRRDVLTVPRASQPQASLKANNDELWRRVEALEVGCVRR